MLDFRIVKRSKRSRGRLGILKTDHGIVETPALVTVATQAAVKTLTSEEAMAAKSQILICNTFHLHLKPGEKSVKNAGGLHKFMKWPRPLMTDSGGFQVFSLGFAKDHGIGKILKQRTEAVIHAGQQPKLLRIGEHGVEFTSYLDGRTIFLGPRESIRIQEALGADIMFAFDEPTSPIATKEYIAASIEKTHRWGKICLDAKRTRQALYGIVQGGRYRDLRVKSAEYIGALPFEGFGIGGEYGNDKDVMIKLLRWTTEVLPDAKPRHLLGIGHPEDIPRIIREGVDTFDCIVPTHYARHGIAFTSRGRLDLSRSLFLKDKKPLDPRCECKICAVYTRNYLCHLIRAKEIAGLSMLTFHNLHYFNTLVEKLRENIKKGKL